ncbi:hypothetical protein JW711_01125 [Candidatus Woesearchaeota archaeon]|nr:hypothetical protein [Candidatus Woesearchaeota archaeon]
MVRKTKRHLLIALGLIALMFFLSGCSGFGTGSKKPANFEDNKYYSGYEGLKATITPSIPPSKIYYYSDTPNNEFDVSVELDNKGTSWSLGAVFLSGYDPNMIEFEGIRPDPSTARGCSVSIGNFATGSYGLSLVCDDVQFGVGGGRADFTIKNAFCSGGQFDGKFNTQSLFGALCGDFTYSQRGDNKAYTYDFHNLGLDVDYANHGRLFIALMQGVDFSRTFGQEYLLAGDTYEFPGGESAYINFRGNIHSWPPGLDQTKQTFLVTNCYMYTTYAAPVVCIDPAPFSETRKVCTPKTYTGTSGQGAPVAITYIHQENTPRQAIFQIHVKNVGTGRVYDPGQLEKCSPYSPYRVTNNELNTVVVGDVRVSGDLMRLDCSPGNIIRLDPKTKEGVVTCTYDIPFGSLKSAYQTPLVVELWYGYEQTTERSVTIKRAI